MKVNLTELEVDVQGDDIKRGLRRKPDSCPLSLSIRRGIKAVDGEVSHVSTGRMDVEIVLQNPHQILVYNLPPEARQFVERFDFDLPVLPVKFKCDLIREVKIPC